MTCGFRNSAGTDLDSLFYINNGNAGALGFRCSNGQDLGNRYTNSATLGYSVGFRNSAGTDLGLLRGSVASPTAVGVAGYGCNLLSSSLELQYSDEIIGESSVTSCTSWVAYLALQPYINLNSNPGGTTYMRIMLSACGNDCKDATSSFYYGFSDNTSAYPSSSPTFILSYSGSNDGPYTQFKDWTVGTGGQYNNRTFALRLYGNNAANLGYYHALKLRVAFYIYNEAGSSATYTRGYWTRTKYESVSDLGWV